MIVNETLRLRLARLGTRYAVLGSFLPESLKSRLRRYLWPPAAMVAAGHETATEAAASREAEPAVPPLSESQRYHERLQREQEIFAGQLEVNDLSPIFHYWSHTYLRPKLEHFGCTTPDEFFANALQLAWHDAVEKPARFVSLGAGNCDTEVRVAQILRARGLHDFVIECLDINTAMLQRGAALARDSDVEQQVVALIGDFNDWTPQRRYDAVMANQSLHHVCNLEGLFSAVAGALTPAGRFVVSDMIGRNGHQRWPEALAIVREFWAELPASYRYHLQLRRDETEFLDWDCSGEGFEGIRAQDILPLLIQHFGFESFLGFANVIDPFIVPGFGGHFDAQSARDRDLIDRIQARDEAGMLAGDLKPTHVVAVMRTLSYTGPLKVWRHLTPQHCLRLPD